MLSKKDIICPENLLRIAKTKGPAKAVIRPEKLKSPNPFPKSFVSNSFVIITRLALCIDPINNEITITL